MYAIFLFDMTILHSSYANTIRIGFVTHPYLFTIAKQSHQRHPLTRQTVWVRVSEMNEIQDPQLWTLLHSASSSSLSYSREFRQLAPNWVKLRAPTRRSLFKISKDIQIVSILGIIFLFSRQHLDLYLLGFFFPPFCNHPHPPHPFSSIHERKWDSCKEPCE